MNQEQRNYAKQALADAKARMLLKYERHNSRDTPEVQALIKEETRIRNEIERLTNERYKENEAKRKAVIKAYDAALRKLTFVEKDADSAAVLSLIEDFEKLDL